MTFAGQPAQCQAEFPSRRVSSRAGYALLAASQQLPDSFRVASSSSPQALSISSATGSADSEAPGGAAGSASAAAQLLAHARVLRQQSSGLAARAAAAAAAGMGRWRAGGEAR